MLPSVPSELLSQLRRIDGPGRAEALAMLDEAISKAERAEKALARRRQRDPRLDELDSDRKACRRLHQFVKRAWHILEPHATFVDNWHLEAICMHLEAVTDGRINRLLINVPPGSMKSLLVSVFWPAWEWAMGHTSMRYLATSFAEDGCKRDTRRMRDLVGSSWFKARWPHLQLVRTADTAISNSGTGWRESSPFGSLTNKRADRLIIDDPHSVKTAESDTVRNDTTQLFREGATNRLNDQQRSAIIVIMQRLHERDLSGVILALMKNEYVHLCLPMEFEIARRCITPIGFRDPREIEGELLDPVRFPRPEVDSMKKNMGAHAYAGQYQQRPTAREGGMFKRHWFHKVKFVPKEGTRSPATVRRWDLAATAQDGKNDPDYTVGVRMCRVGSGENARFYIEDVIRFRDSALQVERSIKATAMADERKVRIVVPEDPGQAGKAQAQRYVAMMAGFDIRKVKEGKKDGDKAMRAEPLAAQLEAGTVFLVEGEWNEEFIEELCAFPRGHDDQVDAAAGAFKELVQLDDGTRTMDLSQVDLSRENPFSVR